MMTLKFRDLIPAFGAEVIGFDPDARLGDDARRSLRGVFDRRGALLFRDITGQDRASSPSRECRRRSGSVGRGLRGGSPSPSAPAVAFSALGDLVGDIAPATKEVGLP